MKTIIRGYIYSVGILLLSMATALFVANLASHPNCYIPCRDPYFNLKLPVLFWIIGGIELVAGALCLFGKRESLQLMVILWLGTTIMICRLSLVWSDATGGSAGYLGDVAEAFGLRCAVANNLLYASITYLLIGSSFGLISSSSALDGLARQSPERAAKRTSI